MMRNYVEIIRLWKKTFKSMTIHKQRFATILFRENDEVIDVVLETTDGTEENQNNNEVPNNSVNLSQNVSGNFDEMEKNTNGQDSHVIQENRDFIKDDDQPAEETIAKHSNENQISVQSNQIIFNKDPGQNNVDLHGNVCITTLQEESVDLRNIGNTTGMIFILRRIDAVERTSNAQTEGGRNGGNSSRSRSRRRRRSSSNRRNPRRQRENQQTDIIITVTDQNQTGISVNGVIADEEQGMVAQELVPDEDFEGEVEDVDYEPLTPENILKSLSKTYRITPKYKLSTSEAAQQEADLYYSFVNEVNHEDVRPANQDEKACCVCYVNVATRVITPCGHQCLCFNCAKNIAFHRSSLSTGRIPKKCPICQAAIASIIRPI